MDDVPFLLLGMALPAALVAGFLYLVRKVFGALALRIFATAFVAISAGLLINEFTLPPAMGNKAVFAAMALITLSLILVTSFVSLIVSFHRGKI